jgi:hypothetical protein
MKELSQDIFKLDINQVINLTIINKEIQKFSKVKKYKE